MQNIDFYPMRTLHLDIYGCLTTKFVQIKILAVFKCNFVTTA